MLGLLKPPPAATEPRHVGTKLGMASIALEPMSKSTSWCLASNFKWPNLFTTDFWDNFFEDSKKNLGMQWIKSWCMLILDQLRYQQSGSLYHLREICDWNVSACGFNPQNKFVNWDHYPESQRMEEGTWWNLFEATNYCNHFSVFCLTWQAITDDQVKMC